MFYFLGDLDIANYTDDFTPYNADKNIEFVVTNLEYRHQFSNDLITTS